MTTPRRIPGRHTQATRCLMMARVLLDGRWRTMLSLAGQFGVGASTVRRDMKTMAAAGWKIDHEEQSVRLDVRGIIAADPMVEVSHGR